MGSFLSSDLQQNRDVMKITIPKPGIEQEVHEEDKEENGGQNGDTELGKENGDTAERGEDLSKPMDAGGGISGEEAKKECLHANGDRNGAEHNEGDGDDKGEGVDEEEDSGVAGESVDVVAEDAGDDEDGVRR